MLKIKPLTGGDTGGYYLKSLPDGPAEYYLDGAASGRWLGRGATALGLDGGADPEAFRRVLAGRHPTTEEMLIGGRAATRGRTPGYDLTISAPKSVSLLAVLSDPTVGDQVREAHQRAVDAALRLVDTEVATVRRGRDGVRQLPAELVAASFQHHTSRAVDPQLHTHVVVANMGNAPDGRWTALHGRRLYGWAKTAGTLYQAHLRAELTERLGVAWGPVRNGSAEIEGFTQAQLEAFSTRRAEIAAELERVGRSDPRSAQLAAWATRDPKVEIPEALLLPRWRARAAAIGLTAEHVNGLTHRCPDLVPPPRTLADDLLGPHGLTACASSFDRRHALEAIANAHPPGLTVDAAAAGADRLLADPRTVALSAPSRLGDHRYSTAELLATETQLLDRARHRRHEGVALARPDALAHALTARPSLSAEQATMIEALTVTAPEPRWSSAGPEREKRTPWTPPAPPGKRQASA